MSIEKYLHIKSDNTFTQRIWRYDTKKKYPRFKSKQIGVDSLDIQVLCNSLQQLENKIGSNSLVMTKTAVQNLVGLMQSSYSKSTAVDDNDWEVVWYAHPMK